METIFQELSVIEQKGIETMRIVEGTFEYLHNTPLKAFEIEPFKTLDDGATLYSVGRNGDLLMNVKIEGGSCGKTLFYQYDWTGSREVIYDENDGGNCIMQPFPSGIPLLQCGKAFYVSVKNGTSDVKVYATYAYLDSPSRRKLATYTFPQGEPVYRSPEPVYEDGVKVRHRNGKMYQATCVVEMGYSPNSLVPIEE